MTYNHRADDDTQEFQDDDASTIGGAMRTTVLLLALGALAVRSWNAVARTHHRRHGARSEPLPRKLQTWEGEGGRPDPDPEPGDQPGNAPTL